MVSWGFPTMRLRWIRGFFVAFFGASATLTTGARAESPADACWQTIMHALDASAHAPHARFTSYGEKATITQDGHTLENVRADITYRDDGLAYVNDDRWVDPFESRSLEPGPPVLGPYGDARNMWLGLDPKSKPALPVIADVHNHPTLSCRDAGEQAIDGVSYEHLYVGEERRNRLGLRQIWIAPQSFEIRRVVVTGPLRVYGDGELVEQTADYTVDVQRVDGYTVVDRVWWKYEQQVYSQRTVVDAEYRFLDYRFSEDPPPGTLSAGTATR